MNFFEYILDNTYINEIKDNEIKDNEIKDNLLSSYDFDKNLRTN